ncbi:MAG: Wzz/FepE/Etk N-terminal domain-containing protein, partial [bacterium]
MEEKDNVKDGDKREEEISLLDIFLVLVKRKGFILKFTFTVAILSIIVSLILPKVYKAEALLLPPNPADTGLSSLAEKIGLPSDLATGFTAGDFWSAVLKSRTVLDDTIDKFGLLKEYKERWKAREALKNKIEFSYDKKSNLLTLAVLDKDPKVAANMATFLVDEMKKISKNLALTPAAQKRAFFEEELQKVKEQFAKAEEDLKKFQEKTKTVA